MLILLTPPETEAAEKTLWIGNTDSKLSKKGHTEAVEFARYDLWFVPHRVFSAPTEHMVELTSILLPFTETTLLPALIDRSMGSLTGRPYRETMVEFPRRNWLAWQRSYWTPAPEGESLFDISDRILTTFRTKILPIPSAECVLVVCAPDVLRLIIGFLTHVEEPEISKIPVEAMVPYCINGDLTRLKTGLHSSHH